MDDAGLRVSQRAPRRCIECARRRIKCDRVIPCAECTKRGTANLCQREKVRLTTKAHDDCPDIRGPSPLRPVKPPNPAKTRPALSNDVSALQAEVLKLRQRVRELERTMTPSKSTKSSSGTSDCGDSTCTVSTPSTEGEHETPRPALPTSVHQPWGPTPPQTEATTPSSPTCMEELSLNTPKCGVVPQQYGELQVPSKTIEPPPPEDPNGQSTTHYELRQQLWSQAGTVYFEHSPHQDLNDQHRLLCITLFGWEYVRSRLRLSPLWDVLEQMYNACQWENVHDVTRLLILDFCWRVIKARAAGCLDATGETQEALLPPFCRPTDLEKLSPGNLMIKFYPWPGVRNAMLVNKNNRYTCNAFTAAYLSQGRFLFPSLDEAFERIPGTDILAFTPEWLRRRDDLGCYTVTSDFLEWYPEFKGIVRTFTQRPTVFSPGGTQEIGRRFYFHLRNARLKKLSARATWRAKCNAAVNARRQSEGDVEASKCERSIDDFSLVECQKKVFQLIDSKMLMSNA